MPTTEIFHVVSNALRVTDPCYDMQFGTAGTLTNVKNGNWLATVDLFDDDGYNYVKYLHIYHQDLPHDANVRNLAKGWEKTNIKVDVDSGQAGFFDQEYFEQLWSDKDAKQNAYTKIRNATDSRQRWGIVKHGVVSSSGFGDGTYGCFVKRNDGYITEAVIVFI